MANSNQGVTLAIGRNGKPIVTTCKHGHLLDATNVRLRKDGTRACIACVNARNALRRVSIRESVDLPQDREPFIDPDCAIMFVAAYIDQAIKDYLDLPEQSKHWKSAVAVLAGENMLLADGAIDTRGYELPARYARKETV